MCSVQYGDGVKVVVSAGLLSLMLIFASQLGQTSKGGTY